MRKGCGKAEAVAVLNSHSRVWHAAAGVDFTGHHGSCCYPCLAHYTNCGMLHCMALQVHQRGGRAVRAHSAALCELVRAARWRGCAAGSGGCPRGQVHGRWANEQATPGGPAESTGPLTVPHTAYPDKDAREGAICFCNRPCIWHVCKALPALHLVTPIVQVVRTHTHTGLSPCVW